MQEPGVPKYLIILNKIVSRIKNNELRPGSKVPSENEIIKEYNVSNTTARKVLQEIEKAGLAVKIRGRGTFVKDFLIERSAAKILSFTRNMIEQGLNPSTLQIDSKVIDKDWSVSVSGEAFTIPGPIFRLRRLRLANDKPMMLETRFISLKYCPEIWKYDLESSLYKIYSEKYNKHIVKLQQDLSAIILDEYSKGKFGIRNEMVGLKVKGVTFCEGELILEAEESIYRGDKYKFSIQAVP